MTGVPVRLLLVEDSENDAMLLLRELRRGGYEPVHERVYTPEDVKRALAEADGRGEPFEIVVSDYYMPRFRAPDALELLRGLGYDAPFIVVSGKIGEDAAVGIMKAGANDYLTKENMARLCPAIDRELKEAQVRRERTLAEERLKEAENRYRTLVEQLPAVTYIQEPTGDKRLRYVSPQVRSVLGYPADRKLLDPDHWVEIMHPDDRERVLAEDARTDRTGEPFKMEYRQFSSDGGMVWIRDEATLVRDAKGGPLYWQGVQYDITDQKLAEEKLRRGEERYRTFIAQSTEGIWCFEFEEPLPTHLPEEEQLDHLYRHAYLAECNDTMARMYGFGSATEIVGARIGDLLPRSEPENVAFLTAAIRAGYRMTNGETRELDRSGNARVIVNNLTGIIEDGYVVRVWGTQRDVTEQKEAEEQLARLASFPELNPNPIMETSVGGEPTYLNPVAQAHFPEIRRLGADHPALADLEGAYRRVWSAGGRPFVREVEVGERFYQQTISRTPEGGLLRIYGVDVTERRRAEDALRESEERFRSLVQNASDIILVLDADGTIVYESPAVERVMGFTPEERIGVGAFDLIHPEDRERVKKVFADHLHRPGPFPPVEYRAMHKNGSWRHLEAVGENLLHDPAMGGVVINARDVTGRRRAEEALRQSEELLRTVVTNAPVVLFSLDSEGVFTLSAGRELETIGLEPDELAGRSVFEVYADAPGVLEDVRRALAGEEFVGTSEVGGVIFETWYEPLIGEGGRVEGVIGVATDVTERSEAEEGLRRTLKDLADLKFALDESAIVSIADQRGAITYVNDKFCEISGYSREELFGQDHRILNSGFHSPEFMGDSWRTIERGRVWREELKNRAKDGSTFWVDTTIVPFLDERGKPYQYAAIRYDITARKRTERELRESEERFRATFEQASVGVALIGTDGELLRVNDKFREILGYGPGELAGKNTTHLTYPDDLERDRALARGALAGASESYSMEKRYVRKDGSLVWANVSASLVRGSAGEAEYFIGVVEDITERRRAEDALRQSEELYRSVVEQATENIFVVDVASKEILEANAALGASLGYAPEELKALTLYDIVAHDRESIDANTDKILQEGRRSLGERRYRRKDGTLADVEVNVSAIPYEGHRAMCIVAHDVTERKRAEGALRDIREAERNRIARELHDSVLQDIVYALQEIQVLQVTGGDDPALQDTADALRRSVEGLRGAIFELRFKETLGRSFVSSVENLVDLNRRMARGSYELEFVVGDGVPRSLPERPGREIVRIVQEALTNVRRHAGASHVRVELGVGGGAFYAEVSDDGHGFDPGEVRVGMGQYSMRQRALDLGGEVEVTSGGRGTRVRCRVPLLPTGRPGGATRERVL